MGLEAVLIDWAGTVTVPMGETVASSAAQAQLSDETLTQLAAQFGEYSTRSDLLIHKAERGEIEDDDLIEHFDEVAPGTGVLFDTSHPASFIFAADRPEMIWLLEDLRDADVTVFLATNNFRNAQESLATRYLDSGLVAAIVNSALVGTRKPEDRYFELCLEAIGCSGDQTLFLDDQQLNLDAAARFGIETLLVEENAEPAVTTVRQLFGLPQ